MMYTNQSIFAPIATSKYSLSDITQAFKDADDHHKNVKVLIDFTI